MSPDRVSRNAPLLVAPTGFGWASAAVSSMASAVTTGRGPYTGGGGGGGGGPSLSAITNETVFHTPTVYPVPAWSDTTIVSVPSTSVSSFDAKYGPNGSQTPGDGWYCHGPKSA